MGSIKGGNLVSSSGERLGTIDSGRRARKCLLGKRSVEKIWKERKGKSFTSRDWMRGASTSYLDLVKRKE